MAKSLKIEKCLDENKWDLFLKSSDYSSIFQYCPYLDALNLRYSCYLVYNKNEIRAGFVIIENSDGTKGELNDFVIYNGIAFGPVTTGQNKSQILSEHYSILEFIADILPTLYESFVLTLSPRINDIRPILWHNYGTKQKKYNIDIRYTSILSLKEFRDINDIEESEVFKNGSKARRQEIRYAKREEVQTYENYNINLFIDLYQATMVRQEIEVDKIKTDQMFNLVAKLHENKLLKMYMSKTKHGEIGSIGCFAIDNNRAYYLFGANDPKLRTEHTGTAILWDTFIKLSKNHIKEIDLEGVNSPKRGWFKLSFGGDIEVNYRIKY